MIWGGWRGIGQRAKRRFNHWLQERDVECGVRLECRRKLEPDDAWINDVVHSERTDESWSQLTRLSGEAGPMRRARLVGPPYIQELGSGVDLRRWQLRAAVLSKGALASRQTLAFWLGNRGGWNPLATIKGDVPVAELTRELWAYSTHGR